MTVDIVGRDRELAQLRDWGAEAVTGQGRLVLIRGEAGVGKTTLALAAAGGRAWQRIQVAASDSGARAFGLIADVLRAGLREGRFELADQPVLRRCLAAIVPELGEATSPEQQAVRGLLEAVGAAVAEMAERDPLVILLEDLHWSDTATLDALGFIADLVPRQRVLVLGTYRTDDVPRSHPIRQLRSSLQRKRQLYEVSLDPLDQAQTAQLMQARLGARPSERLAALVFDRTEGLPFFVEEMVSALVESGSLRPGPAGVELDGEAGLPLPENVRDAVLQRVDRLSPDLRLALMLAAVAGRLFEPGLLPSPGGADVESLVATGLVTNAEEGRLAFRHTLIRDALYDAIPWSRRRAIHAEIARRSELAGAGPEVIAHHWIAAGEQAAGRRWLLAAARGSYSACSYRDAASQLNQALELWPPTVEADERLEALDFLARCAELGGETALGIRAVAEAIERLEADGDRLRYAEAQRRLGAFLELQGSWERAIAARQLAAAAFASAGRPGDAAGERLATAARLRSAGSFKAALEVISLGIDEALAAGRVDLGLRLKALEGNVRARAGDGAAGLAMVRAALSEALAAGDFTGAAEAYQRLADSLEHVGDYHLARTTYHEAAEFCRANGSPGLGDVCLACLTMVLRQTGEWDEAQRVAMEVIASPSSNAHAQAVAHGVLGSILLHRGRPSRARPELHASNVIAQRIGLAAMEIDSATHLARLAFAGGQSEEAADRCWSVVRRWKLTDAERHYSVPNLRWIASFAAEASMRDLLAACIAAVSTIATTPDAETRAAADLVLAEALLLDDDASGAIERFERARAALADVGLPFDRAEVERRAAAAHLRASRRKEALDLYRSAHRIAIRLGARPLANLIAEEVAGMGEKVEPRLGRRAASAVGNVGLSPRELEVVRLVAQGFTSREVAGQLTLSPRTVEMHVHRILGKLDCRRRVDITRRAAELGLLA
jgi:ATP/maltotriose-dependent transcriptional regulator MalT